MTTERIVEIAKNILEHSETDIELGSLCAEINRAAYTFFIEEKGNTMNKNLTNIKTEYFLIGALLFLAAFMINIYIIRRF